MRVRTTSIPDLLNLEIRCEKVRATDMVPSVWYGVVTAWRCGRNVVTWSCRAEEVVRRSVNRILIMYVRTLKLCYREDLE
jgi:hypothetical protein